MKALLLIDIQNDFCPSGALAVPAGDQVVAVANRVMRAFPLVVATQDSHPASHGSFAANNPGTQPYQMGELEGLPQVMWPVHCVAGTTGAALHAGLDRARIAHVVPKGTDANIDSYSGFFDNGKRKATGLEALLRGAGVDDVWMLGLATDYCVKATALDAVALGFRVSVIVDGCRAVNLAPGDGARALDEMRAAGVRLVSSEDVHGGP